MHLGLRLAYSLQNHSNLEAAGAGLSGPAVNMLLEEERRAVVRCSRQNTLMPAYPTLVAPPGILCAQTGSWLVCAEGGQWLAGFMQTKF